MGMAAGEFQAERALNLPPEGEGGPRPHSGWEDEGLGTVQDEAQTPELSSEAP